MSPVIAVFVIWFAVVVVLAAVAVGFASRAVAPARTRAALGRARRAVDSSTASIGRVATAVLTALATWSVVIILGWLLGTAARGLQSPIDEPAFRWWRDHHLNGTWSRVWWKLTDIGDPQLALGLALGGAALLAVLYRRHRHWWAPSAVLLLGYVAERYSQQILKLVVHRGHPPTTLGTWPSGGMARVLVIYGLIIYFLVRRFWPGSPRAWAAGWSVLALCASVQAYARLNNLEHWTTDVVGGACYGLLLLLSMIATYAPWRGDAMPSRGPGDRVVVIDAATPTDDRADPRVPHRSSDSAR